MTAKMAANHRQFPSSNLIIFLLFSLLPLIPFGESQLQVNYYSESCPKAEEIVRKQVTKIYQKAKDLPHSLVRNVFHDCMVKSCDASLLLATKKEHQSELTSPRSFGMRYLSKIDQIKKELEKECPSTVSCADILTLSAREAILLLGGPQLEMTTGRRDSAQSFTPEVEKLIPNHNDSMDFVLSRFESVGINAEGTVALLGAHSVGRVHCVNLVGRLYPTVDPTLDPYYANYLKRRCPHADPNPKAPEYAKSDPETPMVLDNVYYKHLLNHRGLLLVDQQLVSHPTTAPFVQAMAANNSYFHEQFARAFLTLSENNPLTGDQGQIRKDCRHANKS